MSNKGSGKYFKRTPIANGSYDLHYDNSVFVGVIYREVHGEFVISLDDTGGYMAAHHLQGIAEHLNELNQDTYAKELMEYKDAK